MHAAVPSSMHASGKILIIAQGEFLADATAAP
jgi:hypothetical protein